MSRNAVASAGWSGGRTSQARTVMPSEPNDADCPTRTEIGVVRAVTLSSVTRSAIGLGSQTFADGAAGSGAVGCVGAGCPCAGCDVVVGAAGVATGGLLGVCTVGRRGAGCGAGAGCCARPAH